MAAPRIHSKFPEIGRPVATYSIIGIDPEKDLIGVALQSHYFAAGSMVPWAEPGVGAVIIQSIPKLAYDYGMAGIDLMRSGLSAGEALRRLIADDDRSAYRQVAMADVKGAPVNFTGESCVAHAGQACGETYACQANMMLETGVPEAMAEAFTATNGDLPGRLLAALGAAEAKGGDIRGKQAAALVVVRRNSEGHHLEDRPFDLRVDSHEEPLDELDRLVRLKNAYHHNTRGDAALVREDFDLALREYQRSEKAFGGQTELHFWRSLALLNQGREEEAMPLLRGLFEADRKWLTLFDRVSDTGLLDKDPKLRQRLHEICDECRKE